MRRTQAVQRDLPRPSAIRPLSDVTMAESTQSPIDEADRLIQEELVRLVTHDSVAYPPVGSRVAGGKHHGAIQLEDLSDDYLSLARSQVDEEMAGPEAKEKYEAFSAQFDLIWEQIQEETRQLHHISLATQFSVRVGVALDSYLWALCWKKNNALTKSSLFYSWS